MSAPDWQVRWLDERVRQLEAAPPGGGVWGAITGTLGAQTDLASALAGKAASSHNHAWADIISGLPAYATRWPTWSEVTSKPTTFAPSAHNHAWGDITSGIPTYFDGANFRVYDCRTMPGTSGSSSYFPQPQDSLLDTKVNAIFGYDAWGVGAWGSAIVSKGWSGSYAAWCLGGPASTTAPEEWYLRSGVGASWNSWRKVWHDGNFNTEGLAVGTGVNNSANQIVRTNASGYCDFGWINTISGVASTATPARIYCSQDAYIRYMTAAEFARNMPVNVRLLNSSTTLSTQTYQNEIIYNTTASITFTLSNTPPIGTQWQIHNLSTGNITIATGGNTVYWMDGAGAAPPTGNRTLARAGVATVVKIASAVFHIYGAGLS